MIRKRWLPSALLVSFVLVPSFAGEKEKIEEASLERVLTGSFWSTEPGMESAFLMTNPHAASGEARLEVYSNEGRLLVEHSLDLDATDRATLNFRMLAGDNGWGFYRVRYPREVGLLPSQTVLTDATNSWVEPPEGDTSMEPPTPAFHAVVPSSERGPGRSAHITFLVANMSENLQTGTLTLGAVGERSHRWRVPAGQSRRFRVGAPMPDNRPLTLLVRPDGDGASLAISGFLDQPGAQTMPVKFHRANTPNSGELAGFYSDSNSRVLLWNLSERPAVVQLHAIDGDGAEAAGEATLDGGESRTFALSRTLDLTAGRSGALRVLHDKSQTVIGSILDPGRAANLNPLRDTVFEAPGAYSLPVQLDEGGNTIIRVFNPNEVEVGMCVFLAFDEIRYTYPLKKLGAGRYAEIDLEAARDSGVQGELGGFIPERFASAQATVVLHREEGATRNLVANGLVRDAASGLTRVFGCATCAPDLISIEVTTDPINGFVGNDEDIRVKATFANFTQKFISNSATYNVVNRSIADVPLFFTNPQVHMIQAGSTSVTARYSQCKERPPLPGEGTACNCGRIVIEKTDNASIRSIGVNFSPNPLDHIEKGSSVPLTATVSPAIHANLVSFTSSSTTVATVTGTAPNLTVNGAGSGSATITAKIGSSTGPTVAATVQQNTTFPASSATAASGALPSFGLPQCVAGSTFPENVQPTISSLRRGSQWCAMLTGLRGNYSIQARLLPGQVEVTGPTGNTASTNYRAQVTELNALGFCPGAWYMVAAVQAHENVHAAHFQPALQQAATSIEGRIETVCVSGTNMNQSQATSSIQNSSGFANALNNAQMDWLNVVLMLATGDHNGPTAAAEHTVVDPMITSICSRAQAIGWPGNTPCP